MRALGTLVALLLLGSQAHSEPEWTYSEGALEEESWPLEYPACGGQRQSPINLQRKKVQYNPSLQVLELKGYDTYTGEFSMTNNGHTVQVSLPPTMRLTTSDGTEYTALQMHYHWGGASSEVSGSEHTVDGVRRVIEVHMVHYNSKYESYDVAKDASDGLAVLATFIEIDEYDENIYYSQLISQLPNIRYPGQVTTLRDLNIREMLPENVDHYYTYQGSLTTPPCSENVLWFVLANSMFISRAQVWKMENSVLNHLNETLQNGYRNTQPLNQRVVEANFLYHPTQSYISRPEFQSHLSSINSKLEFLKRSIIPKKFKRKSDYFLAGSMSR